MSNANKKFFIILMIIVGIIGVRLVYQKSRTSDETIKIGALLPLTGTAAFWGEPALRGMQLAIEETHNNGGMNGKKIELIVEDSKGDAKQGVTGAQKLLELDKVFTLIAHTTAVSQAVAPLTEALKLPAIFDASDSSIPEKNKYAFKTFYNAQQECARLVRYAKERKGMHTFGLLLPNQMPYAEDCIQGVRKVGDQTVDLRYTFRDKDFRSILLKAKQNNVDALVWIGFPFETNDIHKQRSELGITIPLLCGYKEECISEEASRSVPAQYLNGTISFDFMDISESEFGKRYLSKYPGTTSETIIPAAFGYEEVMMIVTALKGNANGDTERFFRDLQTVEKYPSTIGSQGFDGKKSLILKTRLVEYQDGIWKEVERLN